MRISATEELPCEQGGTIFRAFPPASLGHLNLSRRFIFVPRFARLKIKTLGMEL